MWEWLRNNIVAIDMRRHSRRTPEKRIVRQWIAQTNGGKRPQAPS